MPEPFYGVGMHYVDFEQTSDEEVRAVLLRGGSTGDRSVLYAAQR